MGPSCRLAIRRASLLKQASKTVHPFCSRLSRTSARTDSSSSTSKMVFIPGSVIPRGAPHKGQSYRHTGFRRKRLRLTGLSSALWRIERGPMGTRDEGVELLRCVGFVASDTAKVCRLEVDF